MYQQVKQLRMLPALSASEQILLNEFASIGITNAEIVLTFVAIEEHHPVFYQVELGPKAAQDLREIVSKVLAGLQDRIQNSGLMIQPYDSSAKLDDHELEYLASPEQLISLDRLAPLNLPKRNIDTLASDNSHELALRYYVISIRPPNQPWLHCFRLMAAGSQPHRTKLAIFRFRGAGYFDTLTDPVYYLDPEKLDCLWRGSHMFILDKGKFEDIFDLKEEDQNHARDLVTKVASHLPFSNLQDFLLACQNDHRMAAKIAQMRGQPHLQRLSIARAQKAKKLFGLDIEFERMPDGREALRFVAKYKWQYVSILGDEYLKSPITGLAYESNSKRPIKVRSVSKPKGRQLKALIPGRADVSEDWDRAVGSDVIGSAP